MELHPPRSSQITLKILLLLNFYIFIVCCLLNHLGEIQLQKAESASFVK